MTAEIRRLRLEDIVEGAWVWTDVVSGESGRLDQDRADLPPGTVVLVEMEARGGTWRPLRWLEPISPPPPAHTDPARTVFVNGQPFVDPEIPVGQKIFPGVLCIVRHDMNGRSTAERDKGKGDKSRPALVITSDRVQRQVELSFVFGTNSSVHRYGAGRRIEQWRAAGLRKPSVVSGAVEVRCFEDLGPRIGRLAPHDHNRLIDC